MSAQRWGQSTPTLGLLSLPFSLVYPNVSVRDIGARDGGVRDVSVRDIGVRDVSVRDASARDIGVRDGGVSESNVSVPKPNVGPGKAVKAMQKSLFTVRLN
jgi:hypothetical protein